MSRRSINWSKRGPKPPETLIVTTVQTLAIQMGVPNDQLNAQLRKRAEWWLRRTWTEDHDTDHVTWLHKTLQRICGTKERPKPPRSWAPLTREKSAKVTK